MKMNVDQRRVLLKVIDLIKDDNRLSEELTEEEWAEIDVLSKEIGKYVK